MLFEQMVLPAIVLLGLFAVIIYGIRTQQRDNESRIRGEAFREASAALQSLADIALHASNAHLALKDRQNAVIAAGRHYYYDRAASIVRSIPVDRV